MIKELDDYNWAEAFVYAHPISVEIETVDESSFDREDVKEIFHTFLGENDGEAWKIYGILNDGRYFFLEAWCDYTGWDCQAGGSAWVSDTKYGIENFGLSEGARQLWKITALVDHSDILKGRGSEEFQKYLTICTKLSDDLKKNMLLELRKLNKNSIDKHTYHQLKELANKIKENKKFLEVVNFINQYPSRNKWIDQVANIQRTFSKISDQYLADVGILNGQRDIPSNKTKEDISNNKDAQLKNFKIIRHMAKNELAQEKLQKKEIDDKIKQLQEISKKKWSQRILKEIKIYERASAVYETNIKRLKSNIINHQVEKTKPVR